jgi:hypothetical protein
MVFSIACDPTGRKRVSISPVHNSILTDELAINRIAAMRGMARNLDPPQSGQRGEKR